MSFQKSPPNRKENISMGEQNAEYVEDEIDDSQPFRPVRFHQRQESRDTDMAYIGNNDHDGIVDDADPNDTDAARKVPKSGLVDSPSKQLRMTALFANRQSFASNASTMADEDRGMAGTTPSTSFKGLQVGTPASLRYAEFQERFDNATPVRKVNLGPGKTPVSVAGSGRGGLFGAKPVPSADPGNPFASGTPRKAHIGGGIFDASSAGDMTPSRTFQDKVIDAETEVFDLLDDSNVAMSKKTRDQLQELLGRIKKQSVSLMRARDITREKNNQQTKRVMQLQEELDLARSNKESIDGLDKAKAASLKSQATQIDSLKLELQQVKRERSELEDQVEDLKEQLKKHQDDDL